MENAYINDFTNTVQLYYDDLSCYQPLQKEEELELFRQVKEGNLEARNILIESNLKFVFNIAKRYKGQGVEMAELISEGNLGLLKAFEKFDETRGVKFISYAVWWIREYIQDRIKKIPREDLLEDSVRSLYKQEDLLTDEEDDEEVKDGMNNDQEEEISDEMKMLLSDMLDKLPSRNKRIMELYFGLNGEKEQTLDEIGKELNISKERVRQIKLSSLKVLRSEIMMSDNEELLAKMYL